MRTRQDRNLSQHKEVCSAQLRNHFQPLWREGYLSVQRNVCSWELCLKSTNPRTKPVLFLPEKKKKNSSKKAHLFSSQTHCQLKPRDLSSTPSFPFAFSLGRAGHRKLSFPPPTGHVFLSLSAHSEDEGLAVIFTLYCLVNIVCAHTETSRPDTEPGYPHTCTKNFQGFVTSGSTYT